MLCLRVLVLTLSRGVSSSAASDVYKGRGWGFLGPGSVLLVTITAAFGEEGLMAAAAPACCMVNGVDVRSSFHEVGEGVYTLLYVISEGDDDVLWSPPAMVIALEDGRCAWLV